MYLRRNPTDYFSLRPERRQRPQAARRPPRRRHKKTAWRVARSCSASARAALPCFSAGTQSDLERVRQHAAHDPAHVVPPAPAPDIHTMLARALKPI